MEINNRPEEAEKIAASVKHIHVHDHTCSIYENQTEQFSVVAPFIKFGLEGGDKCLYVADENTVDTVVSALSEFIPDLEDHMSAGRFVIVEKEDAYFEPGYFSPELMIEAIRRKTEETKQQGYTSLRIAAEMSWALLGGPGVERLMEYESIVNHLYEELDVSAICLYNKTRFTPEMIRHVILTHPIVIYKGTVCRNFNFVLPQYYTGSDREAADINHTLEQILDVENREQILRDKNRELQHMNERLRDEISMRKQTEEMLLRTMKDLERSNEELQQFAYVASHDLQEPIRMVSTYTKLLERELKDHLDERTRGFMFFVTDGAKRMHSLIQDLLTFSRVTSRKEKFEKVDLSIILTEILHDFQVAIADHKAEIYYRDLPVLKAAPFQIRQLFQNIIQNAIKFSGENNPVIRIAAENNGEEWLFSISDNGIGIDKEYHEKIFIIFQRLYEKERYPGTGIGLAVCKKIVELHGGRIWVDSEPGRGSTFYFTIPAGE